MAWQYGRFDEALPLLRKAVELDPLSPVIRDVHIFILGQSGRVDEALALSDRLIAERPDIGRNYDTRSTLHQLRGDMVATLRDQQTLTSLDPEAFGFLSHRCHALIDLGALAEAKACVAPLVQRAPASFEVMGAQLRLAMAAGDTAGALALLEQAGPERERIRARILVAAGRTAEGLAVYRSITPEWFDRSTPQVNPAQARDAIQAGSALLKTGDAPRGRALLEAAIAAIAGRPRAAIVADRGWLDVHAYAELGDMDRAFAALQEGVDSGFFLVIAELDGFPQLAELRADPRYMKILAPARARAAAQVNAARAAGLL